MENLSGKTALISGGTTGIGRATAIALAGHGAEVYIFGRHQTELDDALADIKRISGAAAHGFLADVTDHASVLKFFDLIDGARNRLDILVNNAAIAARGIIGSTDEEIHYVLSVNLGGYLFCAREALRRMIPQKSGHIVNIGSMSAETTDPDTDLYTATKAGVRGMTVSLRKLCSSKSIKVTLIEPGTVGTDLVDETTWQQEEMEKAQNMLKAEDVARAIVFALSQPERCDIATIQLKPSNQPI